MIRGILFDFNGTLFFDSKMHILAFRRLFEEYNLPVLSDDEIVHSIFGRTNITIFREKFKPDASMEEAMAFSDKKEALYREICLADPACMKLVDGAEEMLSELKSRNVPFCLATGSPKDNLDFYVEHLGLGRWFGAGNTVYDDRSFPGKPAPDIYRIAAGRIGISPEEALVLEDGTSGMLSALRAGVGAIVPIWEENLPSPLSEAVSPVGKDGRIYHDLKNWREILAHYGI